MTYYPHKSHLGRRAIPSIVRGALVLAWALCAVVTVSAQRRLCNPKATQAAQDVYQTLWAIYGKQALSATVANVDWNTKEAENVRQWTGKWPVMNVFDFINFHASKDVNPQGWVDYSDITLAENWWKEGGLVGCMWHWNMLANNGKDYTCTPGAADGETSFDASKIEDTSSKEYKQVIADIDQIARYLGKMQDAGIPVIWRPLHEAAGNTYEFEGGKPWFWWGSAGADIYKKLWRLMYERLVGYHKLNNLIWVWTTQVADSDWYPGDEYVDVVGRDNYYALQYPLSKEYKTLSERYPDKIVALAECGNGDEVHMSPWSKIWAGGSRWCWFMTWYDYNYNTGQSQEHKYAGKEWWTDAFATGTVLDRDAFRQLLSQKHKYVLTQNNTIL